MPIAEDLTGKTFGNYSVIALSASSSRSWRCICKCGREKTLRTERVKKAATNQGCKSCTRKTHGQSGTPEAATYYGMIHRVTRPTAANTRRNNNLTVGDKTQTLKQWAKEAGVHYDNILKRLLLGWPPKEVVKGLAKTLKESANL
jgi:hypothetical protein